MVTKTKTKSAVYVHPAIDFDDADPRMVDWLLAGQPFICVKPMKRNGVQYEIGDRVVLGSGANDGVLLRRSPTGGRYVLLPDQYYFGQYDRARKKHEQDVLFFARNDLNAFERDCSAINARVGLLKQQLRQAQGEQKTLRNARDRAKAKLEAAEASAPKLDDYMPSANGHK